MNAAVSVPAVPRNPWVDYAKAIGIVLVVYGHVARGLFNAHVPMDEPTYQAVDTALYSFHMPLFFFLSGLFFFDSLRKRGAPGLVWNKVDTLVYPYLVWSILQGTVEVVLGRWTNGQVSFQEVFSLLWAPRAHFWFLYALFLICVLGALVYSVVARRFVWVVAVAGVAVYLARPHLPDVPNLGFVTSFFVFFAAGVWFMQHEAGLRRWAPGLAVLAGVAFAAALRHLVVEQAAGREVDEALRLGIAFLGIAIVVWVCQTLGRWQVPPLAALGQASMVIYLMHVLIGSGARIVLAKLLHTDNLALHLLAGCVGGIGVSMVFWALAARWRPLAALFENPWPLERGLRPT